MTQEEKDKYVEQNENWIASQKNYINGFVIGIRNAVDMVNHHTEYLEITRPQLIKEEKYLEDAKEIFRNSCIENEIEIPEWAK
jgi:hypothetical protein